ncbi:MAG: hypothetical protein NZT92_21785 [Abditibacteriales bacterium]|nr:hypothetical protein [Abditibacteriales bacterium]MDW8368328.1 hypothetical protein [Abditibacteriales bacterium]
MIVLVLLGAVAFYWFVYSLFSRYAQGEVLTVITLDRWQPLEVRLSPDATLSALQWLLVAVMVYLVLDYAVSLVRRHLRRRSSDAR